MRNKNVIRHVEGAKGIASCVDRLRGHMRAEMPPPAVLSYSLSLLKDMTNLNSGSRRESSDTNYSAAKVVNSPTEHNGGS